jgi:ketosteroid isomerase-like protein
MSDPESPEAIARNLIEAFSDADTQRVGALFADNLRAYITNRDGGVDETDAEEYLRRMVAMDLPSAQLKLTINQMVTPRPDMVIAMVEVEAARRGKQLHNHAAHCLIVRGGRIAEWWMVEALPAESEAFWSS